MSTTKSLVIVTGFVGLSIQRGPTTNWPMTFTEFPVVQPDAYPCNFEIIHGYKPYGVENTVPLGETHEFDLDLASGAADSGYMYASISPNWAAPCRHDIQCDPIITNE